jgi:hypothetical protein
LWLAACRRRCISSHLVRIVDPDYATIGGGTYIGTGNLQFDILIAQANNAMIETILAPPCNYSYNRCG